MNSTKKTAVPLKCPFTCSIYGPTGSGKSHFVFSLLKHSDYVLDTPVYKILYCYSIFQPLFEEISQQIPNIEFHEGIPGIEFLKEFTRGKNHCVVVLDDLQSEMSQSKVSEKLFTELSHHMFLSVYILGHQLHRPGKYQRSMTINTQYFVFFASMMSNNSISILARQIFGGNANAMIDAFRDATSSKFGYLLVDVHPQSSHCQTRLRTKIFPSEDCIIYVPKQCTT
jgi:hypothetical protein